MIRSFFSRWRPWHLLLAWSAYWLGLILVLLGPALAVGWKVSRPGNHGSVNASIADGLITASITEAGKTIWSGSVTFIHLALLVAVPPLLLWLVWLAGTSRTNNAEEKRLKNRATQRELDSAEPRTGIIDKSLSTSKRREREES